MKKWICFFGVLIQGVLSTALFSQGGRDIYLMTIHSHGETWELSQPLNITHRPGYDNQPAFTPDGASLFFTSIRKSGQADLYRYDLATQKTTPVTQTPESEYSPTPMPDGSGLSSVRVEMDSVQRLWRFNLDGTQPRVLLEEVTGVGYHTWADAHTLGLFIIADTVFQLHQADIESGHSRNCYAPIGRALQRMPGTGFITFTSPDGTGDLRIMNLNPETGDVSDLCGALPESEDFCWTPDGQLLMGRGSCLYARHPEKDSEWRLAADFSQSVGLSMTRLAVSADMKHLAIVFDEKMD